MDRLRQGDYPRVLVFADGNNPNLDNNVARRFTDFILVSLPTEEDRFNYIKTLLSPCSLSKDNLKELTQRCNQCRRVLLVCHKINDVICVEFVTDGVELLKAVLHGYAGGLIFMK